MGKNEKMSVEIESVGFIMMKVFGSKNIWLNSLNLVCYLFSA